MLKKLILVLKVAVVFFLVYAAGCFAPYSAKRLHDKIKPGMTVKQVEDILFAQRVRFWERKEIEIVCPQGDLPAQGLTKIGNGRCLKEVQYCGRINVLIMGPVFQHNDFYVNFSPDGIVESLTPVRHWD